MRAGAESQDSPRESYDDASDDFLFLGRFNHDRNLPTVGDTVGGTSAGQIYGNPEIFYQIIHTHESLVGDGTVSSAHISSGSAAADAALLADGSGGTGFRSVVVHGDNIVDNTIPTAKYGNLSVTNAKIASVDAAKMTTGTLDADRIPGSLTHRQAAAVTVSGSTLTIPTEDSVQGGDTVLFVIPTPWSVTGNLTARVSQGGTVQASTTFALNDRVGTRLTGSDVVAEEEMEIILATDWRSLVHPVGTGSGGGASLSDATPDSLQPDQTGSAGTATDASRADHAHAIASSTPVGLGTSNQEGNFTSFARTNHVHRAFDSVLPSEHGIGQSGAAGTATIAARRDHVHAIPVGVPVAVGTANAEGTATTASRSDHVHEGDGAGGGVATGFTELRAPATLTVLQTWTATGATIPAADGDEWVRMNGNFDGEVPENFEFLSSRLRTLAEHLVGGSTSTGDVERLQFHDGSVFQRVLMARTAANELILRHEAADQSLGNLSVYSYSSIAGDSDLAVQEEGTSVATAATTINFTGDGATATASGATVTVDIPAAAAVVPTTRAP